MRLGFHEFGSEDKVLSVPDVIKLEGEIASSGTSLLELMNRAGSALAEAVLELVPYVGKCIVLAGSGNNGGDGWVAADKLADEGIEVVVVSKSPSADILAEPARTAAMTASGFDVSLMPGDVELKALLSGAEVVIDAILGTGFSHMEVREPYASWIRVCSAVQAKSGLYVVSADCPSGLNAQTGQTATSCIEAAATITMLAAKPGLLNGDGLSHSGKLFVAPLQ